MKQKQGILYTSISALIFGLTPILAKLSYDFGSNVISLCCYRSWMGVPVLLILLLVRKVPLKLSRKEMRGVLVAGAVFSTPTMFLLFGSYSYISAGLSTTLHFLYPSWTVAFAWLIFREKPNRYKLIALLLATLGIALISGSSDGSIVVTGILLAVGSAMTYAGYMLSIDHSEVKNMDPMKSMFYINIINGTLSLIVGQLGLMQEGILFPLPLPAAAVTLVLAIANSGIAYVLLMLGIRFIGAADAAIFSMLEPVAGVAFGALLLGERLSLIEWISCLLVLTAVAMPVIGDRKNNPRAR